MKDTFSKFLCKHILAFALSTLLFSVGVVQAQQPSPPTPPFSKGHFTAEKLQSFLKGFENKPDAGESQNAKALEIYREALSYLKAAEDWSSKSAGFEKAQKEAPKTLKEIKSKLNSPLKTPKPNVPKGTSLQQLEQNLAKVEAELREERERAVALEMERKHRADRRGEVPSSITKIKKKLEKLKNARNGAIHEEEDSGLIQAREALHAARKKALEEELRCLEKEIESYDAGRELLTSRADLVTRKVSQAEQLARVWQEIVNKRRRTEAEAEAKAAEEAKKEAARAHPLIRDLAEENAILAEKREEAHFADKIERTNQNFETITKTLSRLNSNYQSIASKIQAAGLTPAMGMLLRRQQADLPDVRRLQRSVAARQSEISTVQVQLIELGDERSLLADIESLAHERLLGFKPILDNEVLNKLLPSAKELLKTRRDIVDSIINDYNSYFVKLVDMDAEERRLISETEKFRELIRRHVLWIRSSAPPRLSDMEKTWEAIFWFIKPNNWSSSFQALWAGITTHPFVVVLGWSLIFPLHRARQRIRAKIKEMGEKASKKYSRHYWPTTQALPLTFLLAIHWPLPIWFVGWLAGSSMEASDFARSLAMGLQALAIAYFTVEIIWQISRPNGLAQSHFGWPEAQLKLLRRQLKWLMPLGLSIVFLIFLMEGIGEESWKNSLGRFSFVIGQVMLAIFAHRVFHPGKGIFPETSVSVAVPRLHQFRRFIYSVCVGTPLALAALSLAGYHFTAMELTTRLFFSLWLFLVLLVANQLLKRWFLVSQREHAYQEAQKKRAMAKIETEEKGYKETDEGPAAPEIDWSSVSEQTKNFFRSGLAVALIAGLWVVWLDVLPALEILDKYELWHTTEITREIVAESDGSSVQRAVEQVAPITLADFIFAVLILALVVISAKNIPGLLEFTLLQRLSIQAGERYAITALSRYAITIIGLIMVLGMMGITWGKVQWLVAAITVGLGFGLQEIFANFVSGLILFFERPIKVGDIVTVGNVEGRVSRISIRATTIVDWNRKELVVPNKEFVTGQFINWTLSDPVTRIVIPVGIAYGSNTELARELMLKVAKECTHVVEKPKPKVVYRNFGESALEFELRVFIPNLDHWADVMNQVHTGIDQEFRKAGIEIAFPQRDIHIRSIKGDLQVLKKENQPPSSD